MSGPIGTRGIVSSFSPSREGVALPRSGSGGRLNLMPEESAEATDMEMARFIMALRAGGLRNTSLMAAFERIPRRQFFEADLRPYAYADLALPIEAGEEATSAHLVAQVLNGAALEAGMSVLEIGTGSGYQTALIAAVAGSVVSIERHGRQVEVVRNRFRALGLTDTEIVVGNGLDDGCIPGRAFDRIIVNGSVRSAPELWMSRLAANGLLIVPIDDGAEQSVMSFKPDGTAATGIVTSSFAPLALPSLPSAV